MIYDKCIPNAISFLKPLIDEIEIHYANNDACKLLSENLY